MRVICWRTTMMTWTSVLICWIATTARHDLSDEELPQIDDLLDLSGEDFDLDTENLEDTKIAGNRR